MLATLLAIWFALSSEPRQSVEATHAPSDLCVRSEAEPVLLNSRIQPIYQMPKAEKKKLVTVTYPVADLVVPIQGMFGAKKNAPNKTLERELITLITTAVRPATWSANGGCGQAQYFPLGMSLVVTTDKDTHADVANLLTALRRVQNVQVRLDLQMTVLTKDAFEKSQKRFGRPNPRFQNSTQPIAFLNPQQVQSFWKTVKSGHFSSVMAPRVTVMNGQVAKVVTATSKVVPDGVHATSVNGNLALVGIQNRILTKREFNCLPIVSADRKFVRLSLDFKQSSIAEFRKVRLTIEDQQTNEKITKVVEIPNIKKFAVKGNYHVADGNTVLFHVGKSKSKIRVRQKVPGLSEISDIFGSTLEKEVDMHLVILVTARVITEEEETAKPQTPKRTYKSPVPITSQTPVPVLPPSRASVPQLYPLPQPVVQPVNMIQQIQAPAYPSQTQFQQPPQRPTRTVPAQGRLRFPVKRTQVRFLRPIGMRIHLPQGDSFRDNPIVTPGRFNFLQAAVYRLKVTSPKNRGVAFYPTLEVVPSNPKTEEFLAHNSVPVVFSEEDFEQVASGKYLVKVVYLPESGFQELAMQGPGVVTSTQLSPGSDPIQEARKRGHILLVIRMGNLDQESPGTPTIYAPGRRTLAPISRRRR